MIYVFECGAIVYKGDTLTEEQRLQAVAVESLPVAENRKGFTPKLQVDRLTGTLYYEYIEDTVLLKTQKELEETKQLLNDALDLMIEGGIL